MQIIVSNKTHTKTHKVMDSNKPESSPSAEIKKPSMSRPRILYTVETLQSQKDTFLTAARLLRGGWSIEEKNTRKQDSVLSISFHHKGDRVQRPRSTEISKSEGPTEGRQVPAVNIRKMTENGQIKAGNSEDKAKLIGVLSVEEQGESNTGLDGQKGIVYVRVSSCSSACKRSRRFKPSGLPVIAEM